MFQSLMGLLLMISASLGGQSIVTSQTKLVDKSPETPGLIVVTAKTNPQVPKNTVLFDCGSTEAPFRYSVGEACKAEEPAVDPWAIAEPIITNVCKDFGASAQWTYASNGGTYSNVCITRAMDAVPLSGVLTAPRVFEDITAARTRHFITQKTNQWQAFDNVTVQRINVASTKRGIFIRGGSDNWLIQDFRISGIGVNTSSGDIPVGIGMSGATNIVIKRGEVSNFLTVLADKSKYANADCISNERMDTAWISYVYGHDCSDGIFDLKGTVYLDQTRGENAGHYTYRFWAKATGGDLISKNPGYAHLQMASVTSDVHIKKFTAIGKGSIIKVDKAGGRLTIDECDLTGAETKTLVGGAKLAYLSLGKGCTLPK